MMQLFVFVLLFGCSLGAGRMRQQTSHRLSDTDYLSVLSTTAPNTVSLHIGPDATNMPPTKSVPQRVRDAPDAVQHVSTNAVTNTITETPLLPELFGDALSDWFPKDLIDILKDERMDDLIALKAKMGEKFAESQDKYAAQVSEQASKYCGLHATCEQCMMVAERNPQINCFWFGPPIPADGDSADAIAQKRKRQERDVVAHSEGRYCDVDEEFLEKQENDFKKRMQQAMKKKLTELLQPSLSSIKEKLASGLKLIDIEDPSIPAMSFIEDTFGPDEILNLLGLDADTVITAKNLLSHLIPGNLFPSEDEVLATQEESEDNSFCKNYDIRRAKRKARIDDKDQSVLSSPHSETLAYIEFNECVKSLDDWVEGTKASVDLVLKPLHKMLVKPVAQTTKYVWNGLIGIVDAVLTAPVHLVQGDTARIAKKFEDAGRTLIFLDEKAELEDILGVVARYAGAVASGGISEGTIAAIELAKTAAKAFTKHIARALACLLASKRGKSNQFDTLMYLFNYRDVFGLQLKEPSFIELAQGIIGKYSEANKASAANKIASALSIVANVGGLGGVDFVPLIPEGAFSINQVQGVVSSVEKGIAHFTETHPLEKEPLQRRIGGFMEFGVAPPFRPSNDALEAMEWLAGITLGQYYCQARKFYGAPVTDDTCSAIERIFDTFFKMGHEFADIDFHKLGLLEEAAHVHRMKLKHKLKQKVRSKALYQKF